MEINLEYPHVPNVITRLLVNRKQVGQKRKKEM